ncbi:hypothetical protein GCM10022403_079630 [Streptomyces coacervatus]|uniref:Uncharacterized protein n=1 Tax=Streptomyces coacervatus TaxID=647381 RepID=A0ABP7J6G7_9ACTN
MIHQGPYISLLRDSVLRPDGSLGAYEHVAADGGVRVVALDDQGRVVLVGDDFYLQRRQRGAGSSRLACARASLT